MVTWLLWDVLFDAYVSYMPATRNARGAEGRSPAYAAENKGSGGAGDGVNFNSEMLLNVYTIMCSGRISLELMESAGLL
jgi:hypothetical protein